LIFASSALALSHIGMVVASFHIDQSPSVFCCIYIVHVHLYVLNMGQVVNNKTEEVSTHVKTTVSGQGGKMYSLLARTTFF